MQKSGTVTIIIGLQKVYRNSTIRQNSCLNWMKSSALRSSHLFSMASMFLRSSRSCLELSSSLSENSRWWPVTHSVPLLGGRWRSRSTTSSTLAVLMCSENSMELLWPPRQSCPPRRNHFLAFWENESELPLEPHAGLVEQRCTLRCFDDKEPI